MPKLTPEQKLAALAHRFYANGQWTPKAGDFYTTSRADLELYQIVSIENGIVRTRYTEGSEAISEWPESGFTSEGFGPKRVWVPPWVFSSESQQPFSRAFLLEPGVFMIKADGSGYITIDESDFLLEDDRGEGPDGPEGSVHWIVRFTSAEMIALREFINKATGA